MRSLPPLPDWVALEHKVAQILTQQELHGWSFDTKAAWQLASALRKELEQTCEVLRNRHPFVQGSELLLNEITVPLDMLKGVRSPNLKS